MNKGIVIYNILTIFIVITINQYVSSSAMYKSKVNSIERHYSNLEKISKENKEIIIVIGNSYVNGSMSEDGRNDIYKLIVSGMPMEDMVSIIRTLPRDIDIKKLLIGVGYNYAMPINTYSHIYKKYSVENVIGKIWWSIPLVRGNSLVSTIIREDLKCLLNNVQGLSCKKQRIREQTDNKMIQNGKKNAVEDYKLAKEKMQLSVQRRYEEFVPYTATVMDSFTKNLKEIKSIAAKRNIQLYAYTAPIYEKLRVKLSQKVLKKFRESVVKLDIQYVDLNLVFPTWGYRCFGDATHVNIETGGKETTDYLLAFIGADKTTENNRYARTANN